MLVRTIPAPSPCPDVILVLKKSQFEWDKSREKGKGWIKSKYKENVIEFIVIIQRMDNLINEREE